MKFSEVAHYFDQIEQISSRLQITESLSALLKKASPSEASVIANLSLGQLDPPYIGTKFNIATNLMIKIVASLLDKSDDEIKKQVKTLGDVGLVVQEGGWKQTDDLTVMHVHKELDRIAKISGAGSQEEKIDEVASLLSKLDPLSAKYVVRVIIGKLRLGFSDMTLVDALSWMEVGDKTLRAPIEHAFNICVDIGLIAKTLKEGGIEAIKKMKIHVGIPIRPAAAERLPTAQAIIDKIGPCIAQPKLDGFRLQIHVDKTGSKPKVHFFSRNLLDMSYMFPDVYKEVAQLPVETLIAEGEAIVFDPNTGNYLPFQETVKRKRKHGIEQAVSELPLEVSFFDLLYLNGKSLLTVSHEKRRQQLLSLFKNVKKSSVRVIDEKEINTGAELEEYFTQNIAAGLEGIVVKKPDSVYQPGKRNFNWIKLKRQEEGHLDDTLDCVVLGYYAGRGKRAHFGIGAFLVGVYNKQKDEFQTVAKIGTGLKDNDWKDLKKRCDVLAVSRRPNNVDCAKDLYPDVWVSPEIVVLVRADEITQSPLHTAAKGTKNSGYALRFPRFMGYREDKSVEEATTEKEIVQLYKNQF